LGDTDSIVRYLFAPLGKRRSRCLFGPGGTLLSSLRHQLAIGDDFSGISRAVCITFICFIERILLIPLANQKVSMHFHFRIEI
jgi:hypothetical protein